jgi:predicted HTH transcriptional regulator
MDVRNLKRLIARGENATTEFKLKINHPEKIIREVVAFANTNGGDLFVGVSDDGKVAGLKYPKEDQFILEKAIKDLCSPNIKFNSNLVRFENGKSILHFEILEGSEKPYYAFLKKEHRYGKAFFRIADRSIQASSELRKILKERENHEQPISFEENTRELFKFFENNSHITLTKYRELSGLNKSLASKKLVSLALSGALKIEPREGEDLFLPAR